MAFRADDHHEPRKSYKAKKVSISDRLTASQPPIVLFAVGFCGGLQVTPSTHKRLVLQSQVTGTPVKTGLGAYRDEKRPVNKVFFHRLEV